MRLLLAGSLLITLSSGTNAFTITPVPGSGAGVPQFVASGLGAGSGTNPFYGAGGLTSFRDAVQPLDASAYGNQFQFRSGQILFGSHSMTASPSVFSSGLVAPNFSAPFSARFGLTPALTGTNWSVSSASVGYLATENLLFYSSVSQARAFQASPYLPTPPGLALREDRGVTAARAGVQWQAMPGLTLGVEVSGITSQR